MPDYPHRCVSRLERGPWPLFPLETLLNYCRVDIKADNIMFGIDDDSVFSAFEEQELREPSPRKEVNGRVVYTSRELQMPKNWGAPVLCDFGSAVAGDVVHFEDVQPDIYRAPEVILEAPWSYEIDIWNTGCMVSRPTQRGDFQIRELIRLRALSFRSGISLKVNTCLRGSTRRTGPTAVGRILPR